MNFSTLNPNLKLNIFFLGYLSGWGGGANDFFYKDPNLRRKKMVRFGN